MREGEGARARQGSPDQIEWLFSQKPLSHYFIPTFITILITIRGARGE